MGEGLGHSLIFSDKETYPCDQATFFYEQLNKYFVITMLLTQIFQECLTLDFCGFELPTIHKEFNRKQKKTTIKYVANPPRCKKNIL